MAHLHEVWLLFNHDTRCLSTNWAAMVWISLRIINQRFYYCYNYYHNASYIWVNIGLCNDFSPARLQDIAQNISGWLSILDPYRRISVKCQSQHKKKNVFENVLKIITIMLLRPQCIINMTNMLASSICICGLISSSLLFSLNSSYQVTAL